MELQKLDIEKGLYINKQTIEALIERKPGPFDLMMLQSKIQNDYPVTVKVEGEGLRVLTDLEASEYNHNQFGLLINRLFKRHRLQLRVDTSEFSKEEGMNHERRIEIEGKVIQNLEQTIKGIMPKEIAYNQAEIPKLFF